MAGGEAPPSHKRKPAEAQERVERRRTRVSTPETAAAIKLEQKLEQKLEHRHSPQEPAAVGVSAPLVGLSEYELQRIENIRRNHAILSELGLTALASELKEKPKPVKGAAVNRKAKTERIPVRPRSLRAQNLDADGKPLLYKELLPATPMPEPRKMRKPSVRLDASKVSTGATSADAAAAFLARLDGAVDEASAKGQASLTVGASTTSDLLTLQVSEDDIAKLVPERIFSLEIHPSTSKLLVAAGDTWGRIGLWDVGAGDDAPVATFEPHSRPVAGLRVLPSAPHQLLSCAQDGAVRCLDLSGGPAAGFTEVYRVAEDSDGDYASLHGLSRTAGEGGSLVVCQSDGRVAMLDPRVWGGAGALFALHDKKVYCADYSATRPWLLATSSIDRTVRLWDTRSFSSQAKPKPLHELPHGLAVTAARFSPTGTKLLTTCNDNLLRVYDASGDASWAAKRGAYTTAFAAAKHNNHTGRFITPFQAEWVRGSDEAYVCGSLEQPRGIDVLRADGGAEPRMTHDNVTSVLSLLAWHPTAPILAASNASGKVLLWR